MLRENKGARGSTGGDMRMISRLAVILTIGLSGCAQQASAPAADPAKDEQAIREMDARWLKAAQAHDAAAEAAVFAADGVAYRAHVDPLVGPEAYRTWATSDYAKNPKSVPNWSTDKI